MLNFHGFLNKDFRKSNCINWQRPKFFDEAKQEKQKVKNSAQLPCIK